MGLDQSPLDLFGKEFKRDVTNSVQTLFSKLSAVFGSGDDVSPHKHPKQSLADV